MNSGVSRILEDSFSPGRQKEPKNIDASYVDPLGDQPARPMTAAAGGRGKQEFDEFEDDDIGDDLLPD